MDAARRVDHCAQPESLSSSERPPSCSGEDNKCIILCVIADKLSSQARSNLESMMERQIELRKEETRAIHSYAVSRTLALYLLINL